MHELLKQIKHELKQIEQTGLNTGNLDAVDKMVDIIKDIHEIDKMEGKEMRDYRYGNDYRNYPMHEDHNYGARMRDSRGRYMEGDYGRGGNFINIDPRMWDRIERVMEGADEYQYGRNRYRGGDNEERMHDGLEKMMYAICTFVEYAMDFAETPQEKEIIRKHIQKLTKM